MKTPKALPISILFLMVLTVCSLGWSKTKIRFATVAPAGSTWMNVMKTFDEDLRAQTEGEVEFKFYPNMVMGDEKDVVRKIRLGQIQAAGFTGVGLGEILPAIRVLELPYLFENDEEIDFIEKEYFDYFFQAYAECGFILLGWADVGWVYFLANQKITSPEDLKACKLWSWQGDPLAESFFQELDKVPVMLSLTEVLLSLQTGLIDAVYSPPLAALALQWFTKVQYVSDIPFAHSVGAVLLDQKVFAKMSPETQQIVLETGQKHLRQVILKSRIENQGAYQRILQEGVELVPSDESERKAMQLIGQRVHQRLAGNLYPAELLTRIQNSLQEYRSAKPDLESK